MKVLLQFSAKDRVRIRNMEELQGILKKVDSPRRKPNLTALAVKIYEEVITALVSLENGTFFVEKLCPPACEIHLSSVCGRYKETVVYRDESEAMEKLAYALERLYKKMLDDIAKEKSALYKHIPPPCRHMMYSGLSEQVF